MTQWILTSSLLIAAVLLIRAVGRDRLSARLRYALWGLVLLRLLVPFSIGESTLSVENWLPDRTEPNTQTVVQKPQVQIPVAVQPILPTAPTVTDNANQTTETSQTNQTTETNQTSVQAAPVVTEPQQRDVNWLAVVWAVGAVSVGVVFLLSNLHFALRLRRSRQYVMTEAVPVYAAAVETPCLFGLLRPAVYVTDEVLGDACALRHVLAHELTHYRHGDHLWSLLRCVCVTIHWYNPLVWLAAFASQQDAELACDEGALRRMGDSERTAYARTLLGLSCVGYRGMLTTATSMTGSESGLKNRVLRIVKNPKMTVTALVVVLVLAALVSVMLFSGAPNHELEQVWRSENLADDSEPYESYQELEFADGIVQQIHYTNGKASSALTYPYTVDGDCVIVQDYSQNGTVYAYDKAAGTLTNTNAYTGRTTVLRPYERTDNDLLGDGLLDLRYILDGQWTVDFARNGGDAAMLDAIRSSKVEGRTTKLPENYEYELHYTCDGEERVCYIAEEKLWVDGTGYTLSKMGLIQQELQYMERISNELLTDSAGRSYYLYPQPDVNEVYMWYGENRYYVFDKATELAAELEAVRLYAVEEIPELTMEELDRTMTVQLDDYDSHVQIYPDGTVYDYMTNRYILPEHTEKICALVEEYRWMVNDFATASSLYGSWMLVGAEDMTVYHLSAANGYGTVSTYTVNRRHFDRFELEVDGDSLVLTDGGGTQRTYHFSVDGDRLTLTGEEETLVLENLQQNLYAAYRDTFDVIRRRGSSTEPLLLTEEQKQELAQLIYAGIPTEETEENIIYSDEAVYDLLCVDLGSGTNQVILSDQGKIFFDSRNYKLTNADEVLAYINRLYANMDGYRLEGLHITHNSGSIKTRELTLVVGESQYFWAQLNPTGVYVIDDIEWTVSDASVAELTLSYDSAYLRAKKPGTVTLTLRCGEFTDTAVIHVIDAW